MDQHLLLVILMYSFSEIKAQAVFAPKLTVNPAVIRETDAVTLNCQTPSSVSEVQCEFFTSTGQTLGDSSCLQTLTGTDLLKMNHRRPPVEVKVTCFYKLGEGKSPSLHSETLSILVHPLLPPNLTVSPSVITEMDSVTLNCQTPSYVSVDQCFFYFVKGKPSKRFSCLKTLTGAELLTFTNQNAPAEVEVTCFYLETYQSPESPMSYITIQTTPPKFTASPPVIREIDSVTLNCQTPSSVSLDLCFLYSVREQSSRHISCLKTLTGAELLKMTHQNSPAEVELTCYYTVKFRGGQYQSPHSNVSSITITSDDERKPRTTESMQTFTVVTDIKPSTMESMREETMAKETHIWKLLAVVTGFGVTLGLVVLGLTLLCTKGRAGKTSYKRSQSNTAGDFMSMRNIDQEALLPAGNNGYSVITSVPAAECHTDSEKLKDKDSQNGESDTYHMYATIPEEPAASVLKNPMYSTLQAH